MAVWVGMLGLILAPPGQVRGWAVLGTGGDSGEQGLEAFRCGRRLEIRRGQDGITEGSVIWRFGRVGRRMEVRIVLAWEVVVLAGKHGAAPPELCL